MSKDPKDADADSELAFDVFRSDGSTRLPGQRFPDSEAYDSSKRSGPSDQRIISDASGGPVQGSAERAHISLRNQEAPASAKAPDADPVTIRLQTYQLNLAERLARVKAEQKEALGNLQQLEDESRDADSPDNRQPQEGNAT